MTEEAEADGAVLLDDEPDCAATGEDKLTEEGAPDEDADALLDDTSPPVVLLISAELVPTVDVASPGDEEEDEEAEVELPTEAELL